MRTHEVVEGDKESGQRGSPVEVLEAGAWPRVELVGAVESFNQLLKHPIDFALGIEVPETNNGVFGEYLLS